MKKLAVLAITLIAAAFAPNAKAKIMKPEEVAPVQHNGFEYRAPLEAPGGKLEIWDLKTGLKVSDVQIYEVEIDQNLEADVQWRFISKLSISPDGKYLKVEKAGKDVYLYEFETGLTKLLTKKKNRYTTAFDKGVALKVAEKELVKRYGKVEIEKQKPLTAKIDGDTWIVEGSMSEVKPGGVAFIQIDKYTGEVIKVTHGK